MAGAMDMFDRRTALWFADCVGTPTPVQEEGWPAIARGGHVLISAPTGTGKTLCAFLVFIDRLMAKQRAGGLADGLHLLYISPLKSLSNDIRENLRRPLEGLKQGPDDRGLKVAVRTGDTPDAERREMIKHPPHILITTPESLYLLLTGRGGRDMLSTAKAVIVDELHALIGTKRGAHMMLSLARLDKACGAPLQRIGLSATIEPMDIAAKYLASPASAEIIAPRMEKSVDIQVISPLEDMRALPEGTIWPELAKGVYEQCRGARTAIAFLEGRAQAEKLAHGVNALGGEGFALTHHGCVSKEQRLLAEQRLRSGELRLLCATSSMELGIDVGEVDMVFQIGPTRTIMSAMQRLGRAGHNPGRLSVMRVYPRTAAEGVYCALTASVALSGGIERLRPPRKCLDVLAQHLVSMAAAGDYTVDEALALANSAYNFRDVTRDEITDLLRMLAGDFEHALDRPARARILYDRINETVAGDKYSRMLAVSSGGTIPDRGWYVVRLLDGTRLGEVDEEFVYEARVGDKFLLGAFAWRIAEIGRDSVTVAPATLDGAAPPFWRGDWSGRPYQTGLNFGGLLRGLEEAGRRRFEEKLMDMRLDENAAENAARVLRRQVDATGCLPTDRTIIVEHFKDQSGENQMLVHSVFGGQVNAALAVLLKEQAAIETNLDMHVFHDDDGIMLHPFSGGQKLPEGMLYRIMPDSAEAVLYTRLPATELFNVGFRHNAARALMMGARQGRRLPLWVQRLRGAQALSDAALNDSHPLMVETRRECMEDYWDLPSLIEVLKGIQAGRISVREVHTAEPSPMALPLRRQAEATLMYDYFPTPANAIKSASAQTPEGQGLLPPAPEQLERAAERSRQPADSQQLHALLMAEGDLVAGEVDAPVGWLDALARQGRALYIEPGLWIAAEHGDIYQKAMDMYDAQSRGHIARRCLRYRGPQTDESLCERYVWDLEDCRGVLDALAKSGQAVNDGGVYYHAEVYERARRATVAMRRQQVKTQPPERYAALVCQRLRQPGAPGEQLGACLNLFCGQALAPRLWESVIFPLRVTGYRPGLLDEALSEGEVYWRFTPGDKPLLGFYKTAGIDWDGPYLADSAGLEGDDEAIARELARRGASFAQGLAAAANGRSPLDALLSLAEKGLVRSDSFIPARQWMDRDKKPPESVRARVRSRVSALTAGRWELTRPQAEPSVEETLERAFDRAIVLCRETATGVNWQLALETLRIWEYTGRVRRGYFVAGMSGAQFIRETEAQRVILNMEHPADEIVWLCAADPAQPWGRALAHTDGRAFMCVPGTLAALKGGLPVAVFERQGAQLRLFTEDDDTVSEALRLFARDFELGRLYPHMTRVEVNEYPPCAAEALKAAGFNRQMLDYVLYKKHT